MRVKRRGQFGRGVAAVSLSWAMALLAAGCASLGGGAPVDRRVARPEAGPVYDVLVAELAIQDEDFAGALAALETAIAKDPDSAHLNYRASRIAAQLEEFDRAIAFGERGRDLDPTDVEGRLFLGRLYLHQRNYAQAERALRDGDERPLNGEAGLLLFQMFIERGQPAAALRTAQLLLEDDPANLGAAMAVATVYERMREYDQAEATLRAALEHHPDRFVLYTRLARLYRAIDRRDAEIALYREMLEKKPEHYGTLVSLGEAQIAGDDVEGAIDTYMRLVDAYPHDVQAIKRLASLEFAAGRHAEAADRFQAAFRANPDRPDLAYALGQVERSMGDLDRALIAFEQVPPGHALRAESRMQIAAILEERNQLEAALIELEDLRRVRPNRAIDLHVSLLRARTGDLVGGVAILESMLEENPNDEEVLYQLGILYGINKQGDLALEYMDRVLEKNPDNAHALNYIGYSLAERGEDLERAERLIVRALELSPDDGYIADSLGWVYYMRAQPLIETGKAADGRVMLERARDQLFVADELTGGDPVVSEHLGDVHLLMNDRERALEYYERAVEQEHRADEQPNLLQKLDRLRIDLEEEGASP